MTKEKIRQYGQITAAVVFQLPLGTKKGRDAMKLVVESCVKSCCKTKDEEEEFRKGLIYGSVEDEEDFIRFSDEFFAKEAMRKA